MKQVKKRRFQRQGSCIRKLFASRDIHYSNSLNKEVQKQRVFH